MIRTSSYIQGANLPAKDGGSRLTLALSLRPGDIILLIPEPENPVDRNAILVYAASHPNRELGYMQATHAARICRMMECGAKFRAEVSRIERSRNGWHRVFFDIVQLTEMTSKRRPVRRGAPNYREAWRTGQLVKQPKSEQTTVEVLTGPSQARKFIVGWFLALIAVLVGIAAVVTYLGPKV